MSNHIQADEGLYGMIHEKVQARTPLSRVKVIIFSLVPVLVLLLGAEVAVRVWAYNFRTAYEKFNSESGRLELVPNVHFYNDRGVEFLINSKGFVGPEFDERKPEGIYRIFALGDSCTFGTGYWKIPYPSILETMLNGAGRGQKFEVINAGVEGYNSEYALGRLKAEILRYDPDMVIIYIGWNDLMKVNPSNLSATGRMTWLARLMDNSYLMKGYSKAMFQYLRPRMMEPEVNYPDSDTHVFDNFVPASFQGNLEAMIETLEGRNVKVVLVTLPTVVRPRMTAEELRRRRVFFPYYAGTYSVGKFLSLHRSYNETIRRTAEKRHVALVDLDAIFNQYDKRNLFWDTMHASEKGHRLIADSLFKLINDLMTQEVAKAKERRPVGF